MNEEPVLPPAAPSSRGLVKLLTGGVVIVVIGATAVAAYMHPPTRKAALLAFASVTLPHELSGGHALSVSDTESVLYHFRSFGYERKATVSGHAIAAAPSTPSPVLILVNPGFRLISGDREYYASTSIASLSVSPSGDLFAFARANDLGRPFSLDPGAWETVLVHRRNGTLTPIGGGTAPVFLDETHIVRIMASGIYSLDLASGVPMKLLDAVFNLPLLRLAQSPDRTLYAWVESETKSVVVYRLVEGQLQRVAALPSARTFMLGNDALYELRVLEDGSAEVWKYALVTGDTAKKITTFPKELSITELYL